MANPPPDPNAGDDGRISRWLKVAGIIVLIVILLVIVAMLIIGGGHGPPEGGH